MRNTQRKMILRECRAVNISTTKRRPAIPTILCTPDTPDTIIFICLLLIVIGREAPTLRGAGGSPDSSSYLLDGSPGRPPAGGWAQPVQVSLLDQSKCQKALRSAIGLDNDAGAASWSFTFLKYVWCREPKGKAQSDVESIFESDSEDETDHAEAQGFAIPLSTAGPTTKGCKTSVYVPWSHFEDSSILDPNPYELEAAPEAVHRYLSPSDSPLSLTLNDINFHPRDEQSQLVSDLAPPIMTQEELLEAFGNLTEEELGLNEATDQPSDGTADIPGEDEGSMNDSDSEGDQRWRT
ncbi:hypothetical protein BJ165DRAFT_1397345 [Panaeolus papilionaceus]|nr:hypothetical protein BJ165DRAFT_1397345 [Panaeolus papilionaceus]